MITRGFQSTCYLPFRKCLVSVLIQSPVSADSPEVQIDLSVAATLEAAIVSLPN